MYVALHLASRPVTAALRDAGHNHSPLVLKVASEHALGKPERERVSLIPDRHSQRQSLVGPVP